MGFPMTPRSLRFQGQVAIEFAVLVVIIIAALLVMQIYLKRGISGKLRRFADSIGEQYDPRRTTSDITTVTASDVTTAAAPTDVNVLENGTPVGTLSFLTTITTINSSTTQRQGSETVEELGHDLWN